MKIGTGKMKDDYNYFETAHSREMEGQYEEPVEEETEEKPSVPGGARPQILANKGSAAGEKKIEKGGPAAV